MFTDRCGDSIQLLAGDCRFDEQPGSERSIVAITANMTMGLMYLYAAFIFCVILGCKYSNKIRLMRRNMVNIFI